jgi:hypothetical protein
MSGNSIADGGRDATSAAPLRRRSFEPTPPGSTPIKWEFNFTCASASRDPRGRIIGDRLYGTGGGILAARQARASAALHHTLHRLAERSDRQFGRTHEGVSPVRQLLTLLDQSARGVPRVLRSPPYFRRNVLAGEEVLAHVRGQVGATARAQVRAVLQQVGGKLVLPEALAACAALCDDVIPAEPEEQSPLLVVQLAGPSAVKMNDLVTGERDGIVGRHQLPASRTRRLSHFCIALATRHNSAPHPRSNNLFDQLTQDQRPRSFTAPFLTREKRASVARRSRAHECIASLKLTASADMGKARARDLDASHPAIPHSAGRGQRARGRLHAPTGHDGRACVV